jgi:hypothetical protein
MADPSVHDGRNTHLDGPRALADVDHEQVDIGREVVAEGVHPRNTREAHPRAEVVRLVDRGAGDLEAELGREKDDVCGERGATRTADFVITYNDDFH